MRRHAQPMVLGLILHSLGACGAPVGLESPEDATPQEISLESIEPDFGSTWGGTLVTLHGTGFSDDTRVEFGNADLEPAVLDSSSLTVVTPYVGMEVTVDVRVSGPGGEATLPKGFTFTDSVSPKGGSVEGLVQMSLLVIACPECFGLAETSNVLVTASAGFHDPAEGSWTSWFPSPGTCQVDPPPSVPSSSWRDVGDWVYLSTGSTSLGLQRMQDGGEIIYDAGALGSDDFIKSAAYDLSVPEGDTAGPFTAPDVLLTPQTISTFEPVAIIGVGAQYAFPENVVSRSRGVTFTWGPSGGTGWFHVQIAAYTSQGAYLGQILCRDWDNGSLYVPGTWFSSWAPGSLLAIYTNRYSIVNAQIPENSDIIEGVASLGLLGTATLSN